MLSRRTSIHTKGFTLIELIVVAALIALLAGVVIATITNARNKNNDTSAKDSLNQVRIQADLYYSTGSTYKGVCDSDSDNLVPKGINGMVLNAGKIAGNAGEVNVNGTGNSSIRCNAINNGWAAEVPLRGGGSYYCVDYNRKGIVTTTSIGNNYAFCR